MGRIQSFRKTHILVDLVDNQIPACSAFGAFPPGVAIIIAIINVAISNVILIGFHENLYHFRNKLCISLLMSVKLSLSLSLLLSLLLSLSLSNIIKHCQFIKDITIDTGCASLAEGSMCRPPP